DGAGAAAERNVGWSSSNWAGYIVHNGPFTSVSGQWSVPSVSTARSGYSAAWIGIGGVDEHRLIQVGTQQASRHARAASFAWTASSSRTGCGWRPHRCPIRTATGSPWQPPAAPRAQLRPDLQAGPECPFAILPASLASGQTVRHLTLDQEIQGSNPCSPATPW